MENCREKVDDIYSRKTAVLESIWDQELQCEIVKQNSQIVEEIKTKGADFDIELKKRSTQAQEAHLVAVTHIENLCQKAESLKGRSVSIEKQNYELTKTCKSVEDRLSKITPKNGKIASEAQRIQQEVLDSQKPIEIDISEDISTLNTKHILAKECLIMLQGFDAHAIRDELMVLKKRDQETSLLCLHKEEEIQMFLAHKEAATATLEGLGIEMREMEKTSEEMENSLTSARTELEATKLHEETIVAKRKDVSVGKKKLKDFEEILATRPMLLDSFDKASEQWENINTENSKACEEILKTREVIERTCQKSDEQLAQMHQTCDMTLKNMAEEIRDKEVTIQKLVDLFEEGEQKYELWNKIKILLNETDESQALIAQLEEDLMQEKTVLANCEQEIQDLSQINYNSMPQTQAIDRRFKMALAQSTTLEQETCALNEQIRALEEERISYERLVENRQSKFDSEIAHKEKELAALTAANKRKKQRLFVERRRREEMEMFKKERNLEKRKKPGVESKKPKLSERRRSETSKKQNSFEDAKIIGINYPKHNEGVKHVMSPKTLEVHKQERRTRDYDQSSDASDATIETGEEEFDFTFSEAPVSKQPGISQINVQPGISQINVRLIAPKRKRMPSDSTVMTDDENLQSSFFDGDLTNPSTIVAPRNFTMFTPERKRKQESKKGRNVFSPPAAMNDNQIVFDFDKVVTSTPIASRRKSATVATVRRNSRGNPTSKRGRGSRGGRGSRMRP